MTLRNNVRFISILTHSSSNHQSNEHAMTTAPFRPSVTQSLPVHGMSMPQAPYRPFFLAGILVILTAGAVWGAWLLWQIGRVETFTGVSIHEVNAHGHAQIFGWAGLFIMGFAYQAFPRMWNTTLAFTHFALSAFLLMLIGIILSTLGIWAGERHVLAESAVMVGGIAQIVAVVFFGVQMFITWKRSEEPLNPAVAFMLGAVVWFVLMTVAALWHTLALMQAETYEAMLAQIATYQAALRDMQIHGLALCMILGVSMRFFPGMFGMAKTPAWRGWLGFSIITIAVVAEIILLVAAQHSEGMGPTRALPAAWLALAVGIGVIVLPWRLWRPLPKVDRSTKFVRAAYLWLGISLVMLLLLPVYMLMHETAFSHAYYGAIRHAITVGFVSMMIMGVAGKVVPMLNGIDSRTLPALWIPFVLVNTGCALRVSMQVLSDWHDLGFLLIGFSGLLEVAGLAIWGVGLAWIIVFRKPLRTIDHDGENDDVSGKLTARVNIQPEMTMAEIATQYPQLQPRMQQLGLDTCCSAERTVREIAAKQGLHPMFLVRVLTEDSHPLPDSKVACPTCGDGFTADAQRTRRGAGKVCDR